MTNQEVFVKSPGGVVVASREVNQYFAISSEKQQCLADVINLLGGRSLVSLGLSSLFSFILGTRLTYDVSTNLER